ncbi:6-phosphogluconolactonase [Ornithinimicrobium sp. INDO-MA30-4]|nr:6-phosphogluconolactonase [Ornithinimicrobium sp. INDO-MA30-4]
MAAGDPVWASVHLWWGDERFVTRGHDDRNDQQAFDAGALRWGVPPEQVHSVDAGNDIADLPAAAANYATALAASADSAGEQNAIAAPAMDVLLLGVGTDSHIASLFPGREEVLITDSATVAVVDSPSRHRCAFHSPSR